MDFVHHLGMVTLLSCTHSEALLSVTTIFYLTWHPVRKQVSVQAMVLVDKGHHGNDWNTTMMIMADHNSSPVCSWKGEVHYH